MILAGDYIPKMKQVELNLPFEGTILANLESPVVGDAVLTPSLKSGPNLKSRSLGTERTDFIFNLANNHTMDYGAEGLHLTQDLLREKGIPFVGAGDNLEAARKPIIVEEAGKKIGIIGCCERQFGCADEGLPGCAEKGLWLLKAVADLKKQCDFVIVSSHVAFEHSPLPSPRVREFYKLLIDAGADVIHGHHAHIPQGWEVYGKGVIFYGLGNFVVDPESWHERNYRWSVIANLDFSSSQVQWRTELVGVSARGVTVGVSKLEGSDRAYAEEYCSFWNAQLNDRVAFIGGWQTVCVALYEKLYGVFLKTPHFSSPVLLTWRNRVRYAYDSFFGMAGAFWGKKPCSGRLLRDARNMLCLFVCETHQDVVATALGVLQGIDQDLRAETHQAAYHRFEINRVE